MINSLRLYARTHVICEAINAMLSLSHLSSAVVLIFECAFVSILSSFLSFTHSETQLLFDVAFLLGYDLPQQNPYPHSTIFSSTFPFDPPRDFLVQTATSGCRFAKPKLLTLNFLGLNVEFYVLATSDCITGKFYGPSWPSQTHHDFVAFHLPSVSVSSHTVPQAS